MNYSDTPSNLEDTKRNQFGKGTRVVEVAPGISVCSMQPEYRDCLDRAMDEWKEHKKQLPKKFGNKRYVPGIYAFAYWLIRWSGLVQPTKLKKPTKPTP